MMAAGARDWRAGLSSQAEQQLYMLESGTLSDCTFTVGYQGNTKEFHLHRVVLSRCSEVFEAMLLPSGGRMLEALTGQVTITDIQPHVFHAALKYMYAGQEGELASLPLEEVLGVSGVADKYRVPLLQAACERRMCALLDPSCVWRLLGLCHTLQGYLALRDKCVQLLRQETSACLRSPELPLASEGSLAVLLQQEALALDGELPLVGAAVRWARQQTGGSVRAVLEPRLLPLLRLLALSDSQLDVVCGMAEWITEEEREVLVARDLSALPACFSSNLDKRTDTRAVQSDGPLSEKLCCVSRGCAQTLTSVEPSIRFKSESTSSCLFSSLLEVSSTVWLKTFVVKEFRYTTHSNGYPLHWTVQSFEMTISDCSVEKGEDKPQLHNTLRFSYTAPGGGCDLRNVITLPQPYRLVAGKVYCITITCNAPLATSNIWLSPCEILKESVKGEEEGPTFTFNRRDTVFESLIKGPDFLVGLLFTV